MCTGIISLRNQLFCIWNKNWRQKITKPLSYPIKALFYRIFFFAALPDRGPTITGSRLRYQIGDRVQANCTSGRSRPATRLAWYINGEPAPLGATQTPTHERHEDGLETTSLALDFKVKPKHFRKGDLKLKVRIFYIS